jgi:hypothetical protein
MQVEFHLGRREESGELCGWSAAKPSGFWILDKPAGLMRAFSGSATVEAAALTLQAAGAVLNFTLLKAGRY